MSEETAQKVRISKIVIDGGRFFITYLVTPKYEDVLYLQECLKRKIQATIAFEKDGKFETEELEKIGFASFTTKKNVTYNYR